MFRTAFRLYFAVQPLEFGYGTPYNTYQHKVGSVLKLQKQFRNKVWISLMHSKFLKTKFCCKSSPIYMVSTVSKMMWHQIVRRHFQSQWVISRVYTKQLLGGGNAYSGINCLLPSLIFNASLAYTSGFLHLRLAYIYLSFWIVLQKPWPTRRTPVYCDVTTSLFRSS